MGECAASQVRRTVTEFCLLDERCFRLAAEFRRHDDTLHIRLHRALRRILSGGDIAAALRVEERAHFFIGQRLRTLGIRIDPESDSGDDEEFEIIEMWLLDGDKKIKIPVDMCDIICKAYQDDMVAVARSEFEDDFSYAMAEKAYYDELDCNA